MPDVVVCPRPDMAAAQRQARLRALQGLALRLLVAAQHQRPRGWIQVETHHIPELLFELLVLDTLNVRRRCGLSPWLCQMRATLWARNAELRASERVLQRCRPGGALPASSTHPLDRSQRNRRLGRQCTPLVLERSSSHLLGQSVGTTCTRLGALTLERVLPPGWCRTSPVHAADGCAFGRNLTPPQSSTLRPDVAGADKARSGGIAAGASSGPPDLDAPSPRFPVRHRHKRTDRRRAAAIRRQGFIGTLH